MFTKLLIFLLGVKSSLCTCQTDQWREGFKKSKRLYRIEKVGQLPSTINESSGLATASSAPTFWTHNDSGGKAELYEIDAQGRLISTVSLSGIQNIDWEELGRDNRGNLYIGDVGNNLNIRRDLTIYRIRDPLLTSPLDSAEVKKITYQYEDQTAFPSEKKERNFDCEAFFYFNEKLYLFSKSWGNKKAKLYTLSARPGSQVAELKDSIRLNGIITAADISPDHQTFAVLTYGKIFFFGIIDGQINFQKPISCLKVGRGQVEGLVYVSNTELLMTNEKGKIFRIIRK